MRVEPHWPSIGRTGQKWLCVSLTYDDAGRLLDANAEIISEKVTRMSAIKAVTGVKGAPDPLANAVITSENDSRIRGSRACRCG